MVSNADRPERRALRWLPRCFLHLGFLLLLTLLFAPSLSANLQAPSLELRGESVSVSLRKDYADVQAVFDFGSFLPSGIDRALLPVFASPETTKEQLLEELKLQVVEEECRLLSVTLVDAPKGRPSSYGKQRVVWLELCLGHREHTLKDDSLRLQISYRQKILGGRFLYLPLIAGQKKSGDAQERDWRFQMNLHAAGAIQILSRDTDFTSLGRDAVVFLRDGQVLSARDLYSPPAKEE